MTFSMSASFLRPPNDPVISVNYAFALIALEAEDRPDPMLAKAWLEQAATLEPNDVLNATMVNYARTALAQIDDVKAVSEYAGTFLDGKRPS
jgi:hypothetical protein